ncbi:MAG: carbon starvation protein A [Phycisphaerales bacterium]|nr:carbon starvation protein A [Phycisphaerales bacterium]
MSIFHNALAVTIFFLCSLYIAYKVYGSFLSRKVFGFDDRRTTPAHEFKDGIDFVPTHPGILFGHHFASIAGLGPIIGPAIAVYWGWVPAILWVLIGSVLIGGVHDMAALFASVRHKAHTIGDLTNEIIGPRARLLFLVIIFFLLALAMGVFALNMATLFTDLSPQAVVPTFALIFIAMLIGTLVYKANWRLGRITIVGVGLMIVTTYLGLRVPVPLYQAFLSADEVKAAIATSDDPEFPSTYGVRGTRAGTVLEYFKKKAATDPSLEHLADDIAQARNRSQDTWTYTLLLYAFIASVLPVWFLLQPRDYINSFQLYIGLVLLILGILIWRPMIDTPAFRPLASAAGDNAPPVLPFLFITIACGAVSGFHNLVSSGTTARQIRRESDAQRIGYGAMLTEGLLAVLVILACTAGLSKGDYQAQYGHWAGLGDRALGAFLLGASQVIARPFLWMFDPSRHAAVTTFCLNFVAVVVVSFAMTTLDSGTRLLRYNAEEIARLANMQWLGRNRYASSFVAVVAIGYFALMKIDGKSAGLVLWQLFGTSNQLLAALGLLVASIYLYKLRRPVIYTLLPMLVMMITVSWSMTIKLGDYYRVWRASGDHASLSLLIIGAILALMSVWMVIEAIAAFFRARERFAGKTAPSQPE